MKQAHKMFVHQLSDVQSRTIGDGTKIFQFCVVLEGAKIGKDCNICAHVLIESTVVIGDRVTVKSGVQLWDGLEVEDDVFIGPNATFTNDLFPRSKQYPERFEKTLIEKGASIGANATILAGARIGKYALVGAGAIVTGDVPAHAKVVGNPAKIIGWVCRCSKALDFDADMASCCGVVYQVVNGLVKVKNAN